MRPRRVTRSSSCSPRRPFAAVSSSIDATTSSSGSRTVRRPGLDAAVLRLRPSLRGLALSLDGQGRIASLDPFLGGALAVLEAARNVACAGGEPLGFTDCLNFGNPEKPEIGWELAEAIDGIAAACAALGLPVVSGNVSLYNETNGRAIHPTPVVGAVGLVEDVRRVPKGWREGDAMFVVEASPLSLAGSEYQARFGEVGGVPAPLDLEREARLVAFLWRAAPLCDARPRRLRRRARGVPRRGRALLRRAAPTLELRDDPLDLFGEVGGRAVVSCSPEAADAVRGLAPRARRAVARASGWPAALPCSEWSWRTLRSAWDGRVADVRGLRHSLGGAGRLASRVLRPVRAPAPRPGVGRDRRLRQRSADRRPRHGARRAGLQRAAAAGAAGRGRDRAHALLDDRREPVGERAAAHPPRPRAHGRARAQRQPRERRGAARRARSRTASCSRRARTRR